MRGDTFIHFVCGSRRVNIRLGVVLLIPKSPQLTILDKKVIIATNFNEISIEVIIFLGYCCPSSVVAKSHKFLKN